MATFLVTHHTNIKTGKANFTKKHTTKHARAQPTLQKTCAHTIRIPKHASTHAGGSQASGTHTSNQAEGCQDWEKRRYMCV